jgi:hypothetical protein
MTDTEYDYDNIPKEIRIDPLNEKHTFTALNILKDVIRAGADKGAEAKVGFAYERKNVLEIGEIAPENGEHNSYLRNRNDIVLQVTVRFNRDQAPESFAKLEEKLINEEAEARNAAIEAELARIDAEEAQMAQRKAALEAERAKLKAKPAK